MSEPSDVGITAQLKVTPLPLEAYAMNSASRSPLKALVWIVVPRETAGTDTALRTWLDEHVKEWIEAIKKGASTQQLAIRFVALCGDSFISDGSAMEAIRSAVSAEFGPTEVSFEETSCLRIKYPDDVPEEPKCDLLSNDRCVRVHRLLLIDENGDGYPCYGYWHANRSEVEGFPIPDKHVFMESYENGRFRSLCTECVHAHRDGRLWLYPCSRLGSHVKPWAWDEQTSYCHVQFAGEGKWCKFYDPPFEPSLEHSRSLLEKILTSGDPPFWRTALIEEERELSEFWPVSKVGQHQELTLLPIFGEYDFGLDTPIALGSYPTASALPYNHDQIGRIKQLFLPACFIPPLRALFREHDSVHLVSVILADRHRDSEFNYRSLYRDSPKGFAAEEVGGKPNNWKDVWRLPDGKPDVDNHTPNDTTYTKVAQSADEWNTLRDDHGPLGWRDVTLNLSSCVLDRRTKQPEEYIALFKPEHRVTDIPLGNSKPVIDFSQLIAHINDRFVSPTDRYDCFFVSHSRALKQPPLLAKDGMVLPGRSVVDDQVLLAIWEYCFRDTEGEWSKWSPNAFANIHYKPALHQEFVPCESASTKEDRLLIGSLIANYIIWVFAVFGKEHIGAVESFNATAFSHKEPSQFVVFSEAPLDSMARARFKLTLTTLLQPIESAYAIYAEKAHQQLKNQRNVLRAKSTSIVHLGHSLFHRVGTIERYFQNCHHKPDDVLGLMASNATSFLKDHTTLLQASAYNNLEELLSDQNKALKFVKRVDPDCTAKLSVSGEVERCCILASNVKWLEYDNYHDDYFVQLELVAPHLTEVAIEPFEAIGKRWRIMPCMFTPILVELFDNIAAHGQIDEEKGKQGKYRKLTKRVGISAKSIRINDRQEYCLIIRNPVIAAHSQRGLLKDESVKSIPSSGYLPRSGDFVEWPKDKVHSGPGLAIDTIRQVSLGDLYYRMVPIQGRAGFWFDVALNIRGLSGP